MFIKISGERLYHRQIEDLQCHGTKFPGFLLLFKLLIFFLYLSSSTYLMYINVPPGFICTGIIFFSCIHSFTLLPQTSFYWWCPQSSPQVYWPWVSNLYFSLLLYTSLGTTCSVFIRLHLSFFQTPSFYFYYLH